MLPEKVRIGSQWYAVKKVSPSELPKDSAADVDSTLNLIRIGSGAPPSRDIESFLHEVLHAMLAGHDFQDEEPIVVILGEGLTSFIADNPEFIQSALKVLGE